MVRILLPRMGSSRNCWIDVVTGTVCFPKGVVERLGWRIGQRIEVSYLCKPLTLLLRVDEAGDCGFALHYLNRSSTGGSGGKIRCARLAKSLLRPRFSQPVLHDLEPIYPDLAFADMALFVEQPDWIPVDFDMAGCQSIPADVLGVYEILGTHLPLRIGEGLVRERLKEHLKNEQLVRAAKGARYFKAADKDEAEMFEHLLLCAFESREGCLPQFNRVKG